MKFVDVTNDIAFRKIFGDENRKEVLISFLNAVLCLKDDIIILDVSIQQPFLFPDWNTGKVSILDLKARDNTGKTYIIEMQIAKVEGFDKRILYYASKSYSSQISRGDEYEKLMPTFFIGILDFVATKNTNYISRHIVKDVETGEHFIKDIEFNFIELPKFNKKQEELSSIIDQWIYFIKNAENIAIIPDNIADKGLKVAYQQADKHNWSVDELEAYDKIFIREQDDRGKVSFAHKEGIKEGIKEGKIETAKKLKKLGISIEVISQSTGLTKEEIENI
jgi:predicted transposase/invertase (TIGR01784 family)